MISFIIVTLLWGSLQQVSGENLVQLWKKTPNIISDQCASNPSWTLLANRDDCQKFYVCVNRHVEQHSCAANYYFDRKELRCKLGECPYDDQAKKCQTNAVQRVNGDCTAFAVCLGDKLIQQKCAANHYFAPKFASCQPISNSADHKCSCLLPPFTVISNPDDCEMYYVCIDGKAMLQQCPRGQYYNERVSGCLPDLNGACLVAPTMSPAELDMLDECEKFDSSEAIFRQNTNECNKFFLCLNGRVFSRQCPKGFYFDDTLLYCQRDTSKKCQRKLKKQQAAIIETIGNKKTQSESKMRENSNGDMPKPKPPKHVEKGHKKNKLKVEKKYTSPLNLNDVKDTSILPIIISDGADEPQQIIIKENESKLSELNKKKFQMNGQASKNSKEVPTDSKEEVDNNESNEVTEIESSNEFNEDGDSLSSVQRPPKISVYDKLSSKFVNI